MVKSHFDDQNIRYSNYRAFCGDKFYFSKVYDLIKKLNKEYNFEKTLDVGCADGSFSSKLVQDFGFDAYGIDISENGVRLANRNGIKAKVHNVEKPFPFAKESFDLILACEIIEHVYDTDFFLSELKRVLRKNGILILTTPNLASLVNRVKILLGKYPSVVPEYKWGGAGHIRAYTLPVLVSQLQEHNFKILIKTSPNFTFPMINRHIPFLLKKIAIRLGDFFPTFGADVIIVARK